MALLYPKFVLMYVTNSHNTKKFTQYQVFYDRIYKLITKGEWIYENNRLSYTF